MTTLTAFAGSYSSWPVDNAGGITVFDVSEDGKFLAVTSHVEAPAEAGYLKFDARTSTLYSVDERKTDGRGPVGPAAAVHAMRYDDRTATLQRLNSLHAPGPMPTYLALAPQGGLLACANHGDFAHVEKVVVTDSGWDVRYEYDDSTVLLYSLNVDGSLGALEELVVFNDHGLDPNRSMQAGGHAQASGHAHCAVFSPSGKFLLVADKATDLITVFEVRNYKLHKVSEVHCGQETGPRHLIFNSSGTRVYATLEFASQVASFGFAESSGQLAFISAVNATADTFNGLNEPADLRLGVLEDVLYVNNRGEDSVAWFQILDDGGLLRSGHVPLSKSVHPGLAARTFAIAPSGKFMLVADRPASLVRSFEIKADGALAEIAQLEISNVGFIEFGFNEGR